MKCTRGSYTYIPVNNVNDLFEPKGSELFVNSLVFVKFFYAKPNVNETEMWQYNLFMRF